MKLQFIGGDLHNHNKFGYGIGSLKRAIDIAQSSLDFFAFTPHGQWFDEKNTSDRVHKKHYYIIYSEGKHENHWF